jgi:hypothetical protein
MKDDGEISLRYAAASRLHRCEAFPIVDVKEARTVTSHETK